jgi:hypothetical protein
MKSILSNVASALCVLAASAGPALAFPVDLPEPGSISLVGLGLVAAVIVMRRRNKK